MTARALWREGSYEEQRAAHGLIIPVESVGRALDAVLPAETPVSLTTRLRSEALYEQRLAEGLYPRRVTLDAPHRLGLARPGQPVPAEGRELLREPGGTWFVAGPPATAAAPAEAVPADSWGRLVRAVLIALSLGFPLAFLVVGREGQRLLWPVALLAGAWTSGFVFSLATWLSRPIPPWLLPLFGGLSGAAALARWHRHLTLSAPLPRLEAGLYAAFAVLLIVHHARLPLTGWDGRSIWLFHAKQLSWNGFIPRADLVNPSFAFSHPEYPLLWPAWLSLAGGGPPLDERAASGSIPLLFGALVLLAWALLVPLVGRWPAAALALVMVLGLHRNAFLGYADAILALLLLVQVLGLSRPSTVRVGVLALAASSLLKGEGLVLGVVALSTSIAGHPHLRGRRGLLAGAAALPGIVHVLWARGLHLTGDFPRLAWDQLAEAGPRLATIAAAATDALGSQALLGEGAALALIGLVGVRLSGLGHRPWGWTARAFGVTALTALLFAAMVCAVLLLSPRDLAWHAGRSVDRLLVHPALLVLLLPFLALRGEDEPSVAP